MSLTPLWQDQTPATLLFTRVLGLLTQAQAPDAAAVSAAILAGWADIEAWFNTLPAESPAPAQGPTPRALAFVELTAGAAAAAPPYVTIELLPATGLVRATLRTTPELAGGVKRPVRAVLTAGWDPHAIAGLIGVARGLRGAAATTANAPAAPATVNAQEHVDLTAGATLALHALQAALSPMSADDFAARLAAIVHELPAVLGHSGVVLDEQLDGQPSASSNALGAAPGWAATATAGALDLNCGLSVRVPEEDDPAGLVLKLSSTAAGISYLRAALRALFTGAPAPSAPAQSELVQKIGLAVVAFGNSDPNSAWTDTVDSLSPIVNALKAALWVVGCGADAQLVLTQAAADVAPPNTPVGTEGKVFTLGATGPVAGIGTSTVTTMLGLAKADFEARRQDVLHFTRGS
jgi:hypothetical protein